MGDLVQQQKVSLVSWSPVAAMVKRGRVDFLLTSRQESVGKIEFVGVDSMISGSPC